MSKLQKAAAPGPFRDGLTKAGTHRVPPRQGRRPLVETSAASLFDNSMLAKKTGTRPRQAFRRVDSSSCLAGGLLVSRKRRQDAKAKVRSPLVPCLRDSTPWREPPRCGKASVASLDFAWGGGWVLQRPLRPVAKPRFSAQKSPDSEGFETGSQDIGSEPRYPRGPGSMPTRPSTTMAAGTDDRSTNCPWTAVSSSAYCPAVTGNMEMRNFVQP